jgi:hypothetical protein
MRRSRFLTEFIALYRGKTVAEAKLVAVSADTQLVRRFFAHLMGESTEGEKTKSPEIRHPTSPELVRGD